MTTTFSFKQRTRIGTWNIRTLFDAPTKVEDLLREFTRFKLQILGVCEHRWAGSGEVNIPTNDGRVSFIYSGKSLDDKRESGVELFIAPVSRKALRSWYPVSDRILVARFRTRARNVSIVQVYAPTNVADDITKDCFYEQLSATLDSLPRGDISFLMGDLNAKVGSDNTGREHIMGKHGLGTLNDNGDRFAELCAKYDLVIGGTVFPHKPCHKIT